MIKLFRGFGFRLAALTALVTMLVIASLSAVNYAYIGQATTARVKSDISQEVDALLERAATESQESFVDDLTELSDEQHGHRFLIHLTDKSGNTLFGDRWLGMSATGWHEQTIDGRFDEDGDPQRFLVLVTPTPFGGQLAVARGVHWIDEVKDELIEIGSITAAAGLLLSLLVAWIVSSTVSRRLELINLAARGIMNGNLSKRMLVRGSGDQFDRLAVTLNAMLDRLSDVLQNLEQVSTDIAHDLRTPLGRLRQRLETARSEAQTPDEFQSAIESALKEADGLLTTFGALLRIAQVDAGVAQRSFKSVDLSELVTRMVEAYEPSIVEQGRRIDLESEPDIHVRGDSDLLAQALANLLENALSHTPIGAAITVRLRRAVDCFVLSVADNGPGIPENEREKVLRRFYRLEASRTTPGTGLGLSLIAAIARTHNADLILDNAKPGLVVSMRFEELAV